MAVLMEKFEQSSQPGLAEPVLAEFREEAATTRRVLERIPEEKLAWKPHAKSMSLGQLGWHIAANPGRVAKLVSGDSFDLKNGDFTVPQPGRLSEILTMHAESVRDADQFLQNLTQERANAPWSLLRDGAVVFTKPRMAVIRMIMLSHWYHHRGQLSVYLRLLDIPVPIIYGRSADENPFA